MAITLRHYLEVLALFCVSLWVFTIGLSSQEITGFDSRFYLFAREMLQYGVSWFPMAYQQPYPDYPATSTLLITLAANGFGGLTKLTAVLPSAIMAAITVVFTYLIGALHQKRYGLYAVFFLFMTVTFFKSARSIALDMYPTAITTICFYLLCAAETRRSHTVWIYPLLALGFIFRGPIGLVMPAGVIFVYYALEKRWRALAMFCVIAALLLFACGAVLLSAAHHVGGQAFMQEVLRMEVLGRIDRQALPIYFYFVQGFSAYAVSFPIAMLVLFGMCYFIYKHRPLAESTWLIKLSGWLLVILLGMSIPGGKKIRYILPLIPAAALLAAYPFAMPVNNRYFALIHSVLTKLFLFFPAIFILTVEFLYFHTLNQSLDVPIHYMLLVAILTALQILALGLYYRYFPRFSLRDLLTCLIATISFVVTFLMVVEPIEQYVDRARDLVIAIEQQRQRAHASLVFYRENPDGMPIKYRLNMPQLTQPQFINDESVLAALAAPVFVVTSATEFATLSAKTIASFHIVAHDQLGHVAVVVFAK